MLTSSRTFEVPRSISKVTPAFSTERTTSCSAAAFAVVSTPQASIAGQALNPIGRMDDRELVERIAQQSGNLHDVEQEDTRTVTILGSDEEVTRFRATAERSGVEVPVYVEVARVEDDGDFVVAVGVYPQGSDEMRSQVTTMFGGVEH